MKTNIRWIIIFLCIILICLSILFLHGKNSEDGFATIKQNGRIIRKIDLSKVSEPYEFKIVSTDGGYNIIRVEHGKIGVIDADCPDKICVKRGLVEKGSVPAVCLPHRLSVSISGNKKIDAVAGGQ